VVPRSIGEIIAVPPITISSDHLKKFWNDKMPEKREGDPLPAPVTDVEGTSLRRSLRLMEKTRTEAKLAQVDIKILPTIGVEKPLSILPPETLREARVSPWWPQYKKACEAEMLGHEKNGTWELVPISTVPQGKNILRGKFVFDDKRGEDGKIIRFKARFVAMGFTQQYGSDYFETFAGVVVTKTFRMMLSILNENPEYEMEHWDIKMAFTMAPVEEELYMYQPEGFIQKGADFVCRLKKSLYGLKQAARNFMIFTREVFLESKFFILFSDACVFVAFTEDRKGWCICCTHVDDIFALFNKLGKIIRDRLFKNFEKYVEIDNLGPVSWALKTCIQRDREKGVLKISQEQFVKAFLEKQPAPKISPVPVVTSGEDMNMDESDLAGTEADFEKLRQQHGYQSNIGSLWWLAQISRPDIYFAVHRASMFQNKPSEKLWRWIQNIKAYLAGTQSVGLVYTRKEGSNLLSAFVDAAFATEYGAKSRIGWYCLFLGNLISWQSEIPKRILTSSTEVECRALSQFIKENQWQRQFQQELKLFDLNGPTLVFEDNTASIALATNPGVPHKRSKHFGIEWAHFKQAVEFGEAKLVHVPTEEQAADLLTKALPRKQYDKLRNMVMGDGDMQAHFDIRAVAH
jgi:hypothetical protein